MTRFGPGKMFKPNPSHSSSTSGNSMLPSSGRLPDKKQRNRTSVAKTMASLSVITSPQWLTTKTIRTQIPSASLTLLTGSRRRISVSSNAANHPKACSSLLHCSFLSPSSSSLSSPSSFSGLSLGMDFGSSNGLSSEKRRGLVVRAGKAALCQTKRNRSRKSLARTYGFRRRMRTTSGRAMLKRRRAKGRKFLCTKSNPKSGKRY
ncbi:hypothetical protein PTKIN_Ptkin18bG0113400 [Pterospermum kingtungense]